MIYHQVMFRTYLKKEGRTFKYHGYTDRMFRRLYKSIRFEDANSGKSTAKVLVRQMANAIDEESIEKLEAKMLSRIGPKQFVGYLD